MTQLRTFGTLLLQRLSEPKPLMQVLIGPRQVGKTTALKAILPSWAVYETADSPVPMRAEIINDLWDKAESERGNTPVLAIDEIQKIQGWSEVIKKRWDTQKAPIKVILTGSSSLQIEKGLRESLVGRFELVRAEHWNYSEAHKLLNISKHQYIEWGCYPGAHPFLKDPQRWGEYIRDSIVEPVLGRDLLQLHAIENPALLRQIFGVATALPSQVISLQKLQGQIQDRGSISTIQRYLELLKQAFLVTSIEKYHTQVFQSRKSSPKLIVHDNALIRCFERPITRPVASERMGHYFENLIGARFIEAGWDVFYWKDRELEVDFVVNGPEAQAWAIEVKLGKTSKDDLKGLFQFVKHHPTYEPCLISFMDQEIEGVRTLPVETLLSINRYAS